jgi:hypothetical protein
MFRNFWILFHLLYLSVASGQTPPPPPLNLTQDMIPILSSLPQEISDEIATLEDKLGEDSKCPERIDKDPSCSDPSESLLPDEKKKQGWRTLFEIKYMPINEPQSPSIARARYRFVDLNLYRSESQQEIQPPKTATELDQEVDKIHRWFKLNAPNYTVDPFNIRTQIIIDQLANSAINSNNEQMAKIIREFSTSMNDSDFLRFLSTVAGYVEYNDARENFLFEQNEQTQGRVTPHEQITGSKNGICGDIHSMIAKMAEQRGWEAFTVGYALKDAQHVVTAVHNPSNPDKIMIVNYGRYEERDFKNGLNFSPTPLDESWRDIGTQLRIFKNNNYADNEGEMRQIATLPTALGSFLNDLFKKEHQASRVMPGNQNYRSNKLTFENQNNKSDTLEKDNKITHRDIGQGITIYEGEMDNARVFGIAVGRETFKKIYRFDEDAQQCLPKTSKYFATNFAANLVDLKNTPFNNSFYAYLNIRAGRILEVYSTDFFQFKGILGYEVDGFYSSHKNDFLTADGNFTTLVKLISEYKNKGTNIHLALGLENNIGLKDQGLMTDFSTLGGNLQLGFNALKLTTNLTQELNSQTKLTGEAQFTGTRVGSHILLTTGVVHKNTTLQLAYSSGLKSIPIGNYLQNTNLLLNRNNPDGLRLGVTQRFPQGSVSAHGGINPGREKNQFFGGAAIKVDLNKKK